MTSAVSTGRCAHSGRVLAPSARANKRHCSNRCRAAASQARRQAEEEALVAALVARLGRRRGPRRPAGQGGDR
jgi:hypothetical protein